MKKLLCVLLAGLMLLSVVACANTSETPDGEDSQSTAVGDTAGQANETEAEAETEDPDFTCDLSDDLDFGGKSVSIIYSNDTAHGDELVPDSRGGVVSDAVKERNMLVEEQLNIKLNYIPKDTCTDVTSAVSTDITSGSGEFEIVANGTYESILPILEGSYVSLSKLENIDTSKHYWTQGYNEMVTFTDENLQFLASGPIAISMFRLMYLTIYNKQLFEDNQLPDLYETVKAGGWTLDYQYSLILGQWLNQDNDSEASEGDFYGFVTGNIISVDPYMVASDLHLITRDEVGDLVFNGDSLSKLSDVCDKVQKLYNDQATYVYDTATYDDVDKTYIIDHFNEERALMATTMFLQMERNFGDLSELTYGIAPMPKYDELQENYHSYVQDQVTCFGISSAIKDTNRRNELAAVLEAMAYHSYKLVRPAYYDTALSERYMQDPESSQILDMIFDTLDFDFSSTCSNIFGSSAVIRDQLRPLLSGSTNTISSTTANWTNRYNRNIDRNITPKLDKLKDAA